MIKALNIKNPLNPEEPTTVVVWHYYNGNIKNKFDALITEFNETVGMEKGIVVDAQSQGDVNQLATAVYESANARLELLLCRIFLQRILTMRFVSMK